MGELRISAKERRRLELLAWVRDKQVTLAKVAEVLALSYRHIKRLWKRYQQHGDAGLAHRLHGRPSALHRAVPCGLKLAEVLSLEELRVVTRDWIVAWRGRWFQLTRENTVLPAPARRIVVRQLRDGKVQLLYQGQKLRWHQLPERSKPGPAPKPLLIGPRRSRVPTADHP